ncbi:hypothetical protein SAMN02745218_02783 [Desulfofundulus australicus DSM 11792]|uniref:Uncharacterized protein n=1 Tax=Desulfofundulus australicus DSM 11792 TaxID=1121425 RepID=A0A1M5DCK0_9FIRM|nr:hypothetical protein [Desulfofundulus australicus]SHF64422.1 hypothetical protein SAMN02745218_02783 [Desulfofundulus australicus DSM 11792]
MLIEILTRNMDKKPVLLTFLSAQPGLHTRGNEISVDGLKMIVGDSYIYITTKDWEWGEKIVPLLFSIVPNTYASSHFEPVSDQRILVTAAARPLPEIMERLTLLEHLDLEAQELAGQFQVHWQSRDVAVSCPVSLMIQGGVAVAKIKFITHFRDAEYHCRQVLNQISLAEVLRVFTPEVATTREEPRVGTLTISSRKFITPACFAEFLNNYKGQILYLEQEDALRAFFDPAGHLTFRQNASQIEAELYLESPEILTEELHQQLTASLGFSELTIHRTIDKISLDPELLIKDLKFKKEPQFHLFTRSGTFLATYNIKERQMELTASVELGVKEALNHLVLVYRAMESFTGEVLEISR